MKLIATTPKNLPIILVVDIGTSSIRCTAFYYHGPNKNTTNEAKYNAGAVELVGAVGTVPGRIVFDDGTSDAELVRQRAEAAIGDCLHQLRERNEENNVFLLGFATFAMSFVGVDSHGVAVTPVLTYADNHPQTAGFVQQIQSSLESSGQLETFKLETGAPLHVSYAPGQLLRLRNHNPTAFAQVSKWQSISGYCISRWTHQPSCAISTSEAAWTGLVDLRSGSWHSGMLQLLNLDPATLPEVLDSQKLSTTTQTSTPTSHALFESCRSDFGFFLGLSDGAAANIGSGCTDANHIAVTIGTSAAARAMLPSSTFDHASVPSGLWCYRISRDMVLLGGALTDGASVLQWVTKTLRLTQEELDEMLTHYTPDHGLTMLPFLNNERAPGWSPSARATISGIRWNTTPQHIVFAAVESVTLRLGLIVDLIARHVSSDAVIVASGGALESLGIWRQIVADVSGRTVVSSPLHEITSQGVARWMAMSLGVPIEPSQQGTDQYETVLKPRVEYQNKYKEAGAVQKQVYQALVQPSPANHVV
eukprot:c7376_g1_i1.p1 GENE.c7376_g1_i1~~c7376_g1_i1.p1  ORF type:complete len:534 (-),score=114.99 c7376_g1_i1:19-1620(-)